MGLSYEQGISGEGIQTVRMVTDVINNCNLGCHYCHPMQGGWGGEMLSADQVGNVLQASEDRSLLEVTLTGGEITMHPEFEQIMDGTHRLGKTALSIVTNATKITPEIVDQIARSRVDRVCVSIDGPDAQTHNSRRGRNFDIVMGGLRDLQETGKPITAISVVHKQNYKKLPELSEMLANEGLADEHHMCAACYSGAARRVYDRFALGEDEFHATQAMVDEAFDDLKTNGLYTTFNSYWPAMGQRGRAQDFEPRTMTSIQFSEQSKNIYGIVRPNGDVRLTTASWGRETVGNAVVGNLNEDNARVLLERVDDIYRLGRVRQLPRAIEAGHKFHVGPYRADYQVTNQLLAEEDPGEDAALQWEPVRQLSEIDLMQSSLGKDELTAIVCQMVTEPERWRVVKHASGVDVVFDRRTCHMTLLKPEETEVLGRMYDDYVETAAQ